MEEIVFTSELGKENIQRLLKKNLIRKISSGIYTSNFKDSIEDIIKLYIIFAALLKGK